MKMTILVARVATPTMTHVQAQEMRDGGAVGGMDGFGGGFGGQQQNNAKPALPKPKADENAYNAALKQAPCKPHDPWHGVH